MFLRVLSVWPRLFGLSGCIPNDTLLPILGVGKLWSTGLTISKPVFEGGIIIWGFKITLQGTLENLK
jgi:hypothetical protein